MERNTSSPPQGRRPFAQGIPIAEYDRAITGSTDLSGEKKERIEHHRVEDVTDLEKKYRIGRKLGQGSFGTVYLIEEKETGHCFACKSLKKKAGSPKVYEQLQREVAIMKLVRHRNIIKLHEVYETPKKIFLVMEHCGAGELDERFSGCTENDVRSIIRKLADAVGYLHAHSIVHRDIKPANILLSSSDPFDKWNIKVSDFGLATWNNQCTMMENVVGTPLYMAPEILQNLPYSAQCDIWSIGVLTYILLCGFTKEIQGAFQKMVMDGKITYPHEYWKSIAPGAKNLCEGMLRTDPAKRISAKEIISHPWIRGEIGQKGLAQTNVLDMMKSYNAHIKFQKVLRIVLCAVRFMYPIRTRASHPVPAVARKSIAGSGRNSQAAPPRTMSAKVPISSLKSNFHAGINSYSQVPRAGSSLAPAMSQDYSIISSAPSTNRSLGTSFDSIQYPTSSSSFSIYDMREADISSKLLPSDSARLKLGSSSDLLGNIESRSSTRKSKPRSSLDASMMTSSPRSRTDLTASMALSKIAAQERATTSALKRPGAGSSSRTKVVLNATNSPSTSTRETQSTSTTRTDKSTHSREGSEFGGATRAEKASSLTYGKEEADRIGAEILRSTSSLSSKYPSPQRVQPSAQSSAPLGPIITHRRISADNTGSHLTAHPKATCLSPSQKQLSNGFAAKEEKSVSRNNITTVTALTDIQTVLHTSSSSLLPKIGDASLTRRKK